MADQLELFPHLAGGPALAKPVRRSISCPICRRTTWSCGLAAARQIHMVRCAHCGGPRYDWHAGRARDQWAFEHFQVEWAGLRLDRGALRRAHVLLERLPAVSGLCRVCRGLDTSGG